MLNDYLHYAGGYKIFITRNDEIIHHDNDGNIKVYIGSNYTINLVNHNYRNASARVFIDQYDITRGGVVVYRNDILKLQKTIGEYSTDKMINVEWRPLLNLDNTIDYTAPTTITSIKLKLMKAERNHCPHCGGKI